MGELIPLPTQRLLLRTLEELVKKTHKLAEKSENVYLDRGNCKTRNEKVIFRG